MKDLPVHGAVCRKGIVDFNGSGNILGFTLDFKYYEKRYRGKLTTKTCARCGNCGAIHHKTIDCPYLKSAPKHVSAFSCYQLPPLIEESTQSINSKNCIRRCINSYSVTVKKIKNYKEENEEDRAIRSGTYFRTCSKCKNVMLDFSCNNNSVNSN